VIWGTLINPQNIIQTFSENPLFDYQQVFDFSNPRFCTSSFLLLFFLIPAFQPVFFQRISMARNVKQAQHSFIIAGSVCFMMLLVISWVGVLLLSDNKNLDPNNLLAYMLETYSYTGLRGLTAIGIMSIVMSTADSYINSAAVLLTNDILRPYLKKKEIYNNLIIPRIFSIFIGIAAFFLAFKTASILKLLLIILGFYMPVVSVPLLLAIFGFRTNSKLVIVGMGAGLLTVVAFEILNIKIVDSVIPGMLANLVIVMGGHYLLKQPGVWVGIKDNEQLIEIKTKRKRRFWKLVNAIKAFNLLTFCKKNMPNQEYIYSIFGIYCIISVFSTMYSIPQEIQLAKGPILEFVYHTVLVSSSILLTFPIWPPTFKREKFILIAWNLLVPYILVFAPTLLIIVSNFGQFQLMIFLINIVIISLLMRWQVAIVMIFCAMFISIEFYKWYMGVPQITDAITIGLQFKIMYLLLLISSVLIVFLKPKQEQQEATQAKVDHLGNQIHDREHELEQSLNLKYEFLRNIEHETMTPITAITSLGQVLDENYDKLNEQQRRQAIKKIAKSSERLNSLTNNMIDLSKLSSMSYELNKQNVDMTELVYHRLETCKKMYINNKQLEFVTDIEENIILNCDEHYITSTIDNLIINAISYSKEGIIKIMLEKVGIEVKFSITDEGIGVPKEEIYDIFGAFVVSSKTKTPAGGRGIGLALCKKVIELHNGRIWAKSDGIKGTTFIFTVPIA
jgi:signal transduction histidine kinase